ncbi:nucleotidyltransferase family protein [Amylibacter sp.]|nr:nucleotidyltransferase family protein [Amylibacter sp.]
MTFEDHRVGKFPDSSWAWPQGGNHLLLEAAISPDLARAEHAARDWLTHNDIDDASFHENRLQLAIAARLGKSIQDLPEFPRLAGLQRMLWTKSRMAYREALPALKEMASAGILIMLLKGAARVAADPAAQKSRVSHDIDILVKPEDAHQALDILTKHNWETSTGESTFALKKRLLDARSINMFYGHFGDIDLHLRAFSHGQENNELEHEIWKSAQKHMLFDVPVFLPCPEDRLATSIWSSALDGHTHSDWIVDCAHVLMTENIDVNTLQERLLKLKISYQSKILFDYLRTKLNLPIPTLPALENAISQLSHTRRLSILLQAKPRSHWSRPVTIARGISKQMMLLNHKKLSPKTPGAMHVLKGSFSKNSARTGSTVGLSAIVSTEMLEAGEYEIDLTIALKLMGWRRRLEYELNSDNFNICRLRSRDLFRRKGMYQLRFMGRIVLTAGVGRLWLEARPAQNLRGPSAEEENRYNAIPFSLNRLKIREFPKIKDC